MNLYSIDKNLLFSSDQPTIRRTLEEAVDAGVSLRKVNLRRARLKGARLDGIRMPGACLWGADLSAADLAGADLEDADCRMASFGETCLAEANCRKARFFGTYFKETLMEKTDFSFCGFSCPSILRQPLHQCRSLAGAWYWHRGEIPCALAQGVSRWNAGPYEILALGGRLIVNGTLQKSAGALTGC